MNKTREMYRVNPAGWILALIAYPVGCWAIYQDTKGEFGILFFLMTIPLMILVVHASHLLNRRMRVYIDRITGK